MDDKPFAPTAQRLRQARAEGNVAKAQELATVASFIGVGAAVAMSMSAMIQAVGGLLIEAAALIPKFGGDIVPDSHVLLPSVMKLLQSIAGALGMGCIVSCTIALFATRATLTPVTCKLQRIAPFPQLQQLFSVGTMMALLRALCSAMCAAALIVPFACAMVAASIGLRTPLVLTAEAWRNIIAVLAGLACVGLVVAACESIVTFRKRHEKLRMTHDEIRRESKEQQGDPHLRSTRKRRHRALLRGGVAAVRTATVVITNPTHIAVALMYAPPEVSVPRIVALGVDDTAAQMRRAAKDAHVPLVEHVPLARKLWSECTEGDSIPLDTYALIAPIIATIMHLNAKDAQA